MRLSVINIKVLILVGMLFLSLAMQGQVIDKVCPSIPYGNYGIKGHANSTYFWHITGGQIIQSNGKDTIRVEWDFNQPVFKLKVVEVSASGCVGDTNYAEVIKGTDPTVYVVGSDSLCVGNSTLLSAYGGMDYLWSTGNSSMAISATIHFDTTFFVIGNDGCGFDTAFYQVKAMPRPKADFTYSPSEIVEYQNTIFTFTGNGASHYQWYFDNSLHNSDDSEVMHNFVGAGYHRVFLYVESDFQCRDTISKNLLVRKSMTNSFTPNNDGVNDFWEIDELKNFPNCRVWIFDRSGAEVFYSNGYDTPWDGKRNGKDLPGGSYYYVIDYGVDDVSTKGIVNILRD